MKRPSFQFYPGDWIHDTPLRTCSVGARGLWIDMLCHMHQGAPYGFLRAGDKAIAPAGLARMCGVTAEEAETFLEELETARVFSRDEEGCIYSRRMVKDESLRNARAAGGVLGAEHGKKGGRPKSNEGVTGGVSEGVTGKPLSAPFADGERRSTSDAKSPDESITPKAALNGAEQPLAIPLRSPLGGPENNPPSSSSSSSSNTPISPDAAASPSLDHKRKGGSPRMTEAEKRIAAIFHRRPETALSEKERRACRSLGEIDPDELTLVEKFYRAQWPPKCEANFLRHNVLTFLNHFQGEVDKARNWEEALANPNPKPAREELSGAKLVK